MHRCFCRSWGISASCPASFPLARCDPRPAYRCRTNIMAKERTAGSIQLSTACLAPDRGRAFGAKTLQKTLNLPSAQCQQVCRICCSQATLRDLAQNLNPVQISFAHKRPAHGTVQSFRRAVTQSCNGLQAWDSPTLESNKKRIIMIM